MFPYYGDVNGLSEVLDRNRSNLRRVYKDVLGSQLFGIVEKADEELLTSQSFHSLDILRHFNLSATSVNNKFMCAIGMEDTVIDSDGSFAIDGKVMTAPAFIFTEEGFDKTRNSYQGWVSPYLAPYIHEYDHFLVYSLQKLPMMVAITLLVSKIKPTRWPLKAEDIQKLVLEAGETLKERQFIAYLAIWGYLVHDMYESWTRILDRMIFRRLGYRLPAEYGELPPKQYVPIPIPSIQSTIVVPVGDDMYGSSIRKRMRALQGWSDSWVPSHGIQENFMNSLRKLTVQKVPFDNVLEVKGIGTMDSTGG